MFVHFSKMLSYGEWTKQTYDAVILRAQHFVCFFSYHFYKIANKFNSDHFSGQEPFKVVQLRDGLFCRSTRIPRGSFSFAMNEFLNWFLYFQRIRMNEDERLIRLMNEVWEMKTKPEISCTAQSSKVKMKLHKNHHSNFTRLSILLSIIVIAHIKFHLNEIVYETSKMNLLFIKISNICKTNIVSLYLRVVRRKN